MTRLRAFVKWGGFLLSLGILASALVWTAEIMRPIRRGNAQAYWSSIWGTPVAAPRGRHQAVLSTEGLYLYSDAGIPIHGMHLWEVAEEQVLAAFPGVVDALAGDPSRLSLGQLAALTENDETGDREAAVQKLRSERVAIGRSAERMRVFIAASHETWVEEMRQYGGLSSLLWGIQESQWAAIRVDRARHWWANIAFEAIFMGGVTVFFWLPILWRRASRWAPLVWGSLPVVILLPYYLGYCRWAGVSPDPTFWGGALYPWIVRLFQPLGAMTGNSEVMRLLSVSCILESLNQNPPSMSCPVAFTPIGHFIGLLGPALLGVIIGAAVYGGRRFFRWRAACLHARGG